MSSWSTTLSLLALGMLAALACQRLTATRAEASGGDGSSTEGSRGGEAGLARAGEANAAGGADSGESGGASGGASGGGGEPSSPTIGGAAGADSDQECPDIGVQLCMKPTWPNALVPYALDPGWGRLITSDIQEAIDVWDGQAAGHSKLTFQKSSALDEPTLVFTLEPGCAPSAASEAAVHVAIGSCRETRDIAIAIGMALGVPPMHRRSDRDRYLIVAQESDSECQRRFLEKCADRDGIPAQLGPFDFNGAMFVRPAPSRASCEADRNVVPYVARGLSEAACGWIKGDGATSNPYQGEIAELYAILQTGFRPYAAIGKDLGPSAPLEVEPAPGLTLRGAALVAAPDGGLTALALAGYPPERGLYVVENPNGAAWGDWRELTRNLPEPDSLYGPEVVRRASTSSVVDVTFFNEQAVFHATTDIASGETTSWTTLGAPGGTSLVYSVATTLTASGGLALYAYAASWEPEFAGIYRREREGVDVWSDWQEVPLVTSGTVDLAAVTTEQGTEHLAIAAASGIFYGARAADGVWSAWAELNQIAPPALNPWDAQPGTIAILPGQHEPLGLLLQSSEYLWYSTCFASPCTEATSWTRRNALAGSGFGLSAVVSADHIDIVTGFVETRPAEEPFGNMYFSGLWHKRGPLPLAAARMVRTPEGLRAPH